MQSLTFARALLQKQLPGATPFVPRPDAVDAGVLAFSAGVHAFGEQGERALRASPHAQFSCKYALAPFVLLAGQLGAGRQVEEDCAASVLVQVLGVKESADLKEGFGFFVQHVLSGGLENAHAEGKGRGGAGRKSAGKAERKGGGGGGKRAGLMGQTGQSGKMEQAMGAVMRIMQMGDCKGPEDWLPVMEEYGVELADVAHLGQMFGGDGVGAMGMALPFDLKGKEVGEHRKLGAILFATSQSASSSNVQDAAVEEARERLRKRKLTIGKSGKEGSEGGATGGGAEAAPGKERLAASAAALSARAGSADYSSVSGGMSGGSSMSSSGMLSRGLMPVNTDPAVGLLTYRVACILQWLRIYGSDFISAKMCFKDNPQGKVLPMRHPLRDLPSLLVRFGAVLPPLDESTRLPEWEEWAAGDEAAMKFPEDSSARCFGLGRADGRQSRRNSGNGAAQQGSVRQPLTKQVLPLQSGESCPIVRCRADVDLIVEFAGLFLEAPACAHCSKCITLYNSHVPLVALIANFAYRPAAVLLDRFLSVFNPHSEVFHSLLVRLGMDSSFYAPHGSLSGKRSSSSVCALRERVEKVPAAFLLSLALLCATPLLQQSGTEGGQNTRAGGGSSGAEEKASGRRARSGDCGKGRRCGKGGKGGGSECTSGRGHRDLPVRSAAQIP
ncbi:unnamed protein product [Closterium sp. Yama58-4]|nr:unnamed protein product [Closterium sp. Yama58-4]